MKPILKTLCLISLIVAFDSHPTMASSTNPVIPTPDPVKEKFKRDKKAKKGKKDHIKKMAEKRRKLFENDPELRQKWKSFRESQKGKSPEDRKAAREAFVTANPEMKQLAPAPRMKRAQAWVQKMKKLVKQALRIYLNISCLMELKTTTVSILNLLKK